MTWVRFVRAVRIFATSEVGLKAKGLFVVLMVLLFGISGMTWRELGPDAPPDPS